VVVVEIVGIDMDKEKVAGNTEEIDKKEIEVDDKSLVA
jgi:hypothetical protein